MSDIDYSEFIPNNVDLGQDRRLKRALDGWHPRFLDWWAEMGPEGFQSMNVYLRTAISTEPGGWANFGYVQMPEYRWGIFLSAPEKDRGIPCGDDAGAPAWQTVPGEHRSALQRLIVTQADTEPASVEQQRLLGATAPSLYDLRNLFQVNVEEARHLWAMVYLLHAHFGRNGRDEADALLERRSGDADTPRILDAFNQPCADWLSFYCFTCFTDRDGKYQLGALAESGFDTLSRTSRFMLIEEAHHLFVGEKGMERILRRSAELQAQDPNGDVANQGGIPLEIIQRYVNYWFAYCLDLFGSEISSNASDAFGAGLKGRWQEARKYQDHRALSGTMDIDEVVDGSIHSRAVPLRMAMNEQLRRDYAKDCQRVVDRWNSALEKEGCEFRVTLPDLKFFRRQGIYRDSHFAPDGSLISEDRWQEQCWSWIPSLSERRLVAERMQACLEPGKMANWIAPPARGINGQDSEFEYVKT